MPGFRTAEQAAPALDLIRSEMLAAGRDPSAFGIEPRLHHAEGDPDTWLRTLHGWQAAGATHISFNSMNCGLSTAAQHLSAIQRFAETLR